ncbi:MAG: ABC transporter ATP-binding protein [Bacteroidetes bacterium]|nr:ABC transporter ATP-binding protein [Bacteroidota bacterium]
MNSIALQGVAKKYGSLFLFKNVTTTIYHGERWAITGINGCGKSTLLKIIAGHVMPNKGSVTVTINDSTVDAMLQYNYMAYAAPYLEVPEDMTMKQLIKFYFKFKRLQPKVADQEAFVAITNLAQSLDKPIKNFSSGMKQRLKLALAFLSDTPFLLLDEPLTNLDAQGYEWYKMLMQNYSDNRTVIISSNSVAEEIFVCNKTIRISDYQ